MTDTEMRIAIAQACGKTWFWNGKLLFTNVRCEEQIPDYPNDLNAMHEAEEFLLTSDGDLAYEYDMELVELGEDKQTGLINYMKIWHATARQRAEAFLKVKGLWRDTAQKDIPNDD